MVVKNYYKILDLETSRVSIDEIKTAYRQAAKKYHPDLNVGDALAEERIKDINEAYKVLSSPASKRKYDRMWNSKFAKGKKAFTGKQEKSAIFQMFLGDLKKDDEQSEKLKKSIPVKGENVETQIDVSLYDAFYGLEKQIALKDVEKNAKTYTIKIPEGIRDGEKIRLIGQGKPGKNGGKPGDLLIKINIENDNTSITNNSIRCITEDKFGNIVIGTSHGVNFLNPNNPFLDNLATSHPRPNIIFDNPSTSLERFINSPFSFWYFLSFK